MSYSKNVKFEYMMSLLYDKITHSNPENDCLYMGAYNPHKCLNENDIEVNEMSGIKRLKIFLNRKLVRDDTCFVWF